MGDSGRAEIWVALGVPNKVDTMWFSYEFLLLDSDKSHISPFFFTNLQFHGLVCCSSSSSSLFSLLKLRSATKNPVCVSLSWTFSSQAEALNKPNMFWLFPSQFSQLAQVSCPSRVTQLLFCCPVIRHHVLFFTVNKRMYYIWSDQ